MAEDTRPAELERYSRQMRYPPIGEGGQRRLLASRAVICGCGALGSVLAETLVRAGVGFVRIIDRDFLELSNLQRQVLYDEDDLAAQLPKAVAAAGKLRRINSQVVVEPHVADLSAANIASLCGDVDLIVDGLDNFETRFLINDFAVQRGLPWVYGGCLGAEGQTLTVLPGETACLRCLIPDPPPLGQSPTCDTAGILAPIINVIASMQACEAIKILSGHREAVNRTWTIIGLWDNSLRQVQLDGLREQGDCPCCQRREFPWLDGRRQSQTAVLCGRNSVQVTPEAEPLPLDALAARLETMGHVTRTPFFVRARVEGYVLTVFPDGRAIISGSDDPAVARGVYARYVGS